MTPRALRARWAVARLQRLAGGGDDGGEGLGRQRPVSAIGLSFPSPVGLAAGFDRRGRLLDGAHRLGLGAVEMGTFVVADGLPHLSRPIAGGARCGVSIGKPRHVPWDAADEAYLRGLRTFHPIADYLTLNPGRDCPSPAVFIQVAAATAQLRDRLARHRLRPLPLVAKLPAHWLNGDVPDIVGVADAFVAAGVNGLLVATEGPDAQRDACAILHVLSQSVRPDVSVISVGGIGSLAEVNARLAAGAALVQVHRAVLARNSALLGALQRSASAR
ncbi:MAG TPA: dihydroorotate dehydrogenase [Aromatoleum sp.]|uniref:dihydroorotate dehydrogenase n=1 Tax=Aromatoleum sp. TaxID=2307007 RepID=UPI002B468188|nr:dihydroorotate dehydrogenase [Aromatoleum sp.]HJV27036.1 dihydroorotate dehydrogenase [Aromatoleum sp.]